MAILHQDATIRPTKQELLDAECSGPVELVGSYRFDDPAGEVGVEGFVVRQGDDLRHVVFTYRAAPLDGDARLVSTMEHTTLGPRWVYDAATDPVAVGCFERALRGEQEQAVLEAWEGDRLVGTREPSIRLATHAGGGARVRLVRALDPTAEPGPAAALVARWDGGRAVVAELGD